MKTVELSQHQRVELHPGGQIQAPRENIAQFSALMNAMGEELKSSTTSLLKNPKSQSRPEGSLIEKLALDVHKVETESNALHKQIKSNIHGLNQNPGTDSEFSKAIVTEKFAASAYFVSLNLVGTRANDMAEEVNSVTKGKSS